MRFLALGLVQRGLVGPGIDDEQHLAFAHHVAVLEADRLQVARDPGADIDGILGDELADIVVPVDHRLLQRVRDRDAGRRRRGHRLRRAARQQQAGRERRQNQRVRFTYGQVRSVLLRPTHYAGPPPLANAAGAF